MKRKTAEELLAESFRELAAGKSIDKITIGEIVENCGYSTATFYRHFRDKYDLIAWDYARKARTIMDRLDRDNTRWTRTLQDWAELFQAEKDYLANLLLHTSGHDSFIRHMAAIHTEVFLRHLQAVTGGKELEEKTALLARTYSLVTVCLSCEWILGGFEASPGELAEVYARALPQPLGELLKRAE